MPVGTRDFSPILLKVQQARPDVVAAAVGGDDFKVVYDPRYTHIDVLAADDETRDNAYAHHIQRLMVVGNFALLAGLEPQALHRWYLGIYIDAFEWVELPNTLGMSQHADHGLERREAAQGAAGAGATPLTGGSQPHPA